MSPGQIGKRAEMEARLTLRSKTASKAEKEAAAADLAEATGSAEQGADPSETPLTKGAARAARRSSTSDLAQRRGGGRGR